MKTCITWPRLQRCEWQSQGFLNLKPSRLSLLVNSGNGVIQSNPTTSDSCLHSWDLVWLLLLCWRKWKTGLRSLEAEFAITHEWKLSSYPLVSPVSRTMGCGWPRYPQLPRKTHGLFSSILSYKARKAFWNLFLVAFPKLCSIENRKVSRSPKFREHLGQISGWSFVSERVPRPQTCQQQLISPRGRGPKYSGFLTHFCYTSFLVLFFWTPCRMNIPKNTLRETLASILQAFSFGDAIVKWAKFYS